jgi:alkaline phosphatase D
MVMASERSDNVGVQPFGADRLELVPFEWWVPSSEPSVVRPRFSRYPFQLGVASGSPSANGVVLWTRLAPEPLNGGGLDPVTLVVRWEVATDERFRTVVASGDVDALPGRGHSVHVEVAGLRPNRWYWFRFAVGDEISPIGRTRTLPSAGSALANWRLGLGSCQQFEQGYFNAHRHLVDEDVDLMLFVGDYIYESSWGSDLVRRHSAGEPRTVNDYRNRHAQYKTDADLQALHAAVPWVVTWDDHEVDNDYAGDQSEDLDPAFLQRRSAGYQAFFEHMPLRAAARPRGADMKLYARYDIGRLARLHLLDGRQYRSPQVCPRPGRGGANIVPETCTALFDKDRTMLGTTQERWLATGLRETRDRWNVIAQQTLMARADTKSGAHQYWTDAWDGYSPARGRLLQGLVDDEIRSCVVLSGDAHTNYVADLKVDFNVPRSRVVATEFCGTSITSQGRPQTQSDAIRRANSHLKLVDSSQRGYVVIDLTLTELTARLRVVSTVKTPTSRVSTLATFAVTAGTPGARKIANR